MKERKWLLEMRKARGLTQIGVAKQVGISYAQYSRIETGARNPKVSTARRIGEFFGFDWKRFWE